VEAGEVLEEGAFQEGASEVVGVEVGDSDRTNFTPDLFQCSFSLLAAYPIKGLFALQ